MTYLQKLTKNILRDTLQIQIWDRVLNQCDNSELHLYI
jgi:hypothetical protein